MSTFTPVNLLEQGLESVNSGLIQMSDFLPALIFSDIVVPSGAEPKPDGSGFTPLLIGRAGKAYEMVAAFTSMERVQPIAETTPFCLVIKGGEFLRRMSPNYGLIINPGWSLGMEMSPEGIRRIIENLAESIFEE